MNRKTAAKKIPFCKDCAHFDTDTGTLGYCKKSSIEQLSLVSGNIESRMVPASFMRGGDECGPSGKLFKKGAAA